MKVQSFVETYLVGGEDRVLQVLDVGARTPDPAGGYRILFEEDRFEYTGLDLIDGPNVDVVPVDAFCWAEIPTGTIDVVVSGQAFEHNPYFWITNAEISRVLRPRGYYCLVAPSKGPIHRYPLDCWRFYPDASLAMCSYVGLEIIESYVETYQRDRLVVGTRWGDFLLIATKPERSLAEWTVVEERLRHVVESRCEAPNGQGSIVGPAIEHYESQVYVSRSDWMRRRLRDRWERYSRSLKQRIERSSS